MFFKKKKSEGASDEPITKRGIKKMDAIVTGAILSGLIASIYGVKKIREHGREKKESDTLHHNHDAHTDEH